MRIITHNVLGLPWNNGDITTCIDFLWNRHHPHIFCLQEVFKPRWYEELELYCIKRGWIICRPRTDSLYGGGMLGSGLVIILTMGVRFIRQLPFFAFSTNCGFDRFARKGFFGVDVLFHGKRITVINTHLQSDFTELPFQSLTWTFQNNRTLQEKSLALYAGWRDNLVLIAGDLNMEKGHYLYFLEQETKKATFPASGQVLDHFAIHPLTLSFLKRYTINVLDCGFSDHLPVKLDFDV